MRGRSEKGGLTIDINKRTNIVFISALILMLLVPYSWPSETATLLETHLALTAKKPSAKCIITSGKYILTLKLSGKFRWNYHENSVRAS